jgi:hypothetical protein
MPTSVFCARLRGSLARSLARSRTTGDTRDARAAFFRDFRVRVGGGVSAERNAAIGIIAAVGRSKMRPLATARHGRKLKRGARPVNRIVSRRAVKSAE